MATWQGTVADRQWCDAKSDRDIAQIIAEQTPRDADAAIRAFNQLYRAAQLNFALDPVNMIPINPVGDLLNRSYDAIRGARPALSADEIEPVVTWIRTHSTPNSSS